MLSVGHGRRKPTKKLLGDKYDSAELRHRLKKRGTRSAIPNRSNRKQPFSFSRKSYRETAAIVWWI
jgi:IS5 family transposase